MKHLVGLNDWSRSEIEALLSLAADIKRHPENYRDRMQHKMLMMIFEKPSLRTRVSFETGACQLGGDAIYYDMSTSPLGVGKETIEDTVKCLSRYVDIVMARLFEHDAMEEMARHATIPVINGLTNFNHPCQILADLQTIAEHKGTLAGLTLAYLGDSNNNVTHSLMFGAAKVGMNIRVGCPEGADYSPLPSVLEEASREAQQNGSTVSVTHDAEEAVEGVDVVYTDSWMSYHIPKDQMEARVKLFTPYQVNGKLMKHAAPDAVFMNCLPADRAAEQTSEVIDGPKSIVFDQAENRLHAQKAVMVHLLAQMDQTT